MSIQSSQPTSDYKTRQTSQIVNLLNNCILDFSSLKTQRQTQIESQLDQHRTQKPLLQKRYKHALEEAELKSNKFSLPYLPNVKKIEYTSEHSKRPLQYEKKVPLILTQGNGVRNQGRLPKLEFKYDMPKPEVTFNATPVENPKKRVSVTPESRPRDSPERQISLKQRVSSTNSIVIKTKAGCQMNKITKVNQDSYIAIPNFSGLNYSLVGICDGHGVNGHLVSDLIKNRLPTFLEYQLTSCVDMEQCFLNAFELTNTEILQSSFDTALSGSTTVVFLKKDNQFWTANVGDSRAILCRNFNGWRAVQISRDHKPSDEQEKQRVLSAGGRVQTQRDFFGNNVGPERVWLSYMDAPGLAMTRSMGDKVGAQAGVISVPEIFQFTITPYDKFVIVASDGVWEYLTNDQVMNIVAPYFEKGDLNMAGEKLMHEAIQSWKKNSPARDDITLIIMKLEIEK